MDPTRFDYLTRWLARPHPRRRVVRGTASLLAGVAVRTRPLPAHANAANCCGTPPFCCGEGWNCLADPNGTFRGCCQGIACYNADGTAAGCCSADQFCSHGQCVGSCPNNTGLCNGNCDPLCPDNMELTQDCVCKCLTNCGDACCGRDQTCCLEGGGINTAICCANGCCGSSCKGDPQAVCCQAGPVGVGSSCGAGQVCCGPPPDNSCCNGRKERCARGKCVKKKKK